MREAAAPKAAGRRVPLKKPAAAPKALEGPGSPAVATPKKKGRFEETPKLQHKERAEEHGARAAVQSGVPRDEEDLQEEGVASQSLLDEGTGSRTETL